MSPSEERKWGEWRMWSLVWLFVIALGSCSNPSVNVQVEQCGEKSSISTVSDLARGEK